MPDNLSASLVALAAAASTHDTPDTTFAHLAPRVLTTQTEEPGMYTVEVRKDNDSNGSYEWHGYANGVSDAMYRAVNG
jgi:hypothetical protein